jgi:hypothetical protein
MATMHIPKIKLVDVVHRGIHNSYMKATCNYSRARYGGLFSPPRSFNLGWLLRIPQQSGCAESYGLPNRKIHEREKKKQRGFFDELFGELL